MAGVASTRGTVANVRGTRTRQALVTVQVALSLALLCGALLFGGTLRNLLVVRTGFRAEGVSVVRVSGLRIGPSDVAGQTERLEMLERIRGIPGVMAAAEVRHAPFSGTGTSAVVRLDGTPPGSATAVRLNGVTDGYFETMGVAMTAGRAFSRQDSITAPRVAIVNEAFVRRLGVIGSPVGQRVHLGQVGDSVEIVGTVPDTKHFTLREDFLPMIFVPKAQITDRRSYTDFVARSNRAVTPAALHEALGALDVGLGLDVQPFAATVRRGLLRERLLAVLSAFFGVLAAAIAIVGVYGVMLELVARRRAEIAVRMALGAVTRDIFEMLFRRVGALLAAGLVLGAAIVSAGAGSVRALVFGVQPLDARVIGIAAVVLAGASTIAASWPAHRAATTDPLSVLRDG
jgi:predicted permease